MEFTGFNSIENSYRIIFRQNKKMQKLYTSLWYDKMRGGKLTSSEKIIPIICNYFSPKSIIDVGCGDGTWLAAFKQHGVSNIFGVDGEWVLNSDMQISQKEFQSQDLDKPFELDERFDVAISIEVAEHLRKESAGTFVESLAKLSDIIVFSAAIPLQGGVNHINEQWQSYWAALFLEKGFVPVDCIRPLIWYEKKVTYIYKQNIVCYIKKGALENLPEVKKYIVEDIKSLDKVHPDKYIKESQRSKKYQLILENKPGGLSFRKTLKYLFTTLWASIKKRA